MNPHPIFVHFPIALLTIYSVLELIRWKRLTNQQYWFYIKAVFIMLGGVSALAALATGDIAKEALQNNLFHSPITNFRQVVSMHELFADIAIVIFGILAACYLAAWLDKIGFANFTNKHGLERTWRVIVKIYNLVINTPLVILLAILGLIVITITGGLGGILVYGPNADPFFKIMYSLLFN